MGGGGALRIVGTVAFALSAAIGCGKSTSSDGADGGQSGTGGQSVAGTSGQGSSGHPSGGAGSGGQAGSATGAGGTSGRGGGSGSGGAGASAGTGATAGDGGGSATGGITGNAGAGGESAGEAGDGSAGRAGGSASVDCTGTFGEPHVVFESPGRRLFSPTLTADETELLYAVGDADDLRFYRSTRSSRTESFGPGEPLPELDAACVATDSRTIDLSSDGLRAYLVCYGGDGPNDNALRLAVRSALDAPFVLDPMSYGEVAPSAAVAPGELTLYSSGVQPSEDPALVFERSATSEPFGAGMEIPGLEGSALVTPDVSPDGLSLFGSLMGAIVLATRASVHDPFSTAEPILGPPAGGQWISATVSEDCRSLYAVRQAQLTVEVFTR